MSSDTLPPPACGQLVRLKSGGPLMTIRAAWEGDIMCDWFDIHGKLHNSLFQQEMLLIGTDELIPPHEVKQGT